MYRNMNDDGECFQITYNINDINKIQTIQKVVVFLGKMKMRKQK